MEKKFEKKSKGRGKYSKSKFSKDSYASGSNDGEFTKLSGSNDISWYNQNQDLLSASSKIPFGRPLGNALSVYLETSDGVGTTVPTTVSEAFPGIVSLHMMPSIGCSLSGTQTIDVAAKSIYSWVRHANSGHTNYDSPDLMIYLLACANVYAAAGYLLKLYATLNTYEATNRYLPRGILRSLGVDDWLQDVIADFRYFCSQWFKKAQVLYTPKKLPLFEKAFWMYTQIYEEDKTGKSPLYQYVPDGFYFYNPTKYTTGGCLEFRAIGTSFNSLNDITTYFNLMLERLINDEDMGIMSGDIKKAFADNTWTLGDFPFEATLKPVRDSFVLQQMHNATPVMIKTGSSADIVQDNSVNELLCFPHIDLGPNTYVFYNIRGHNVFIDIDSAVPSEAECIEATQYTNTIIKRSDITSFARISAYETIIGSAIPTYDFVVSGTSDYICTHMSLVQMSAGVPTIIDQFGMGIVQVITNYSQTVIYSALARYSTLEWAPFIVWDSTTFPVFGSIHNCTLITDDIIDNMHDCSWLSMLSIPASKHIK